MQRLLIILLLLPSVSFAQKQNNIWYFGDKAGVDFNSGSPVALTNSAMQSFEGTASICDGAGNLLFYTNAGPLEQLNYQGGVWNSNHQLMPNGNLDSIYGGCNSAVESSLIVPDPANSDLYYVFTLDCWEHNNIQGGLRYCKVDMTLDGGLGDVTMKGIQITDSVTESMCGMRHANGIDYWVVVHKWNASAFYAYQITSTGISPPVITNIGPSVNSSGPMKASVDDSKIAFAINPAMLLDFDNATGILSNYINLNNVGSAFEFSANCRFLYAQVYINFAYQLYQYDLTAPNIPTNYIVIADTNYVGANKLQLGPDGKIYMAGNNEGYMDVIHSPDLLDTLCNYVADDFYLDGRIAKYGIVNLINSLYGGCNFTEVGIEETEEESSISIYPNPSTGIFTVQGATSEIQVYDLFGRLVLETPNKEIDMGNYPAGIYMVRLVLSEAEGAGEAVRKLILR